MPIIISRKTGQIVSAPDYTQEQKRKAWEIIVENGTEGLPEGVANEWWKPDEICDNLTENK